MLLLGAMRGAFVRLLAWDAGLDVKFVGIVLNVFTLTFI